MASSNSSQSSASSTTPSSLPSTNFDRAPFDDDEHWTNVNIEADRFVRMLLKDKKQADVCIKAWRIRCETLEEELGKVAQRLSTAEEELLKVKSHSSESAATGKDDKGPKSEGRQSHQNRDRKSTTSRSIASEDKTSWRVARSDPIPEVDPTKSMSKQSPPPCNAFYLLGECLASSCKFSHRYRLSPDNIEEMRRGAKFHLCNSLKNGNPCPDTCCYGHVCPRGNSCSRVGCAFNDEQHRGPPTVRPRRI